MLYVMPKIHLLKVCQSTFKKKNERKEKETEFLNKYFYYTKKRYMIDKKFQKIPNLLVLRAVINLPFIR